LSHGDNGVLYGKDTVIPVENFIQPIKNCRTLAGKPKIFIFQVCTVRVLYVLIAFYRVTTHLENLEKSDNSKVVREKSG